MKATKLILSGLVAALWASASLAGEEVDRLLAEYGKIKTVTCQIRRTKEGEKGKIKFLSRVYWRTDNRLHAEGISPDQRRTIADGNRLWQYVEGAPKGFSREIADLSQAMSISLRMVPGTPMDHLLRLKDLDETILPPDAPGKQVALQAETHYVILQLDGAGRLCRISFYKTPSRTELEATYNYSDFADAVPGIQIAMTHEITFYSPKSTFKETVKIDRFIANEPVAESLFIPSSFFDKDIDFVDDFAKIFPR